MASQSDYTSDAQGRAKLTLTVNATATGANWSASVVDGSSNYGGYAYSGGSWSVTVGGQNVASASGKSYDFGSGVISSPYFPRSASGSVTLSPGTYTASATFSGDGSTVGTASVSFSFTVAAPTTYAVTIDPNNGSSTYTLGSYASGASVTAPSAPTRSGYTFNYWVRSDTSETVSANGSFSMPAQAITLTASWTSSGGGTTNFTYSYNSNGGSNTPSGATVAPGTGIILGSPGTRSGYTFTGWYSSATSTTYGVGASYSVNADTTFTAQWSQDGGGATYPPSWTDNTLAAFIAGKTYSDAVVASNMNYSGSYSVSSGSLPSGISLNTSTGAITGTVTSATDYSFTITATNSYSSVQQAFSGSITGGIRVYSEGQWGKKVLRVYDSGEWKPATVNVYNNGSWSPSL